MNERTMSSSLIHDVGCCIGVDVPCLDYFDAVWPILFTNVPIAKLTNTHHSIGRTTSSEVNISQKSKASMLSCIPGDKGGNNPNEQRPGANPRHDYTNNNNKNNRGRRNSGNSNQQSKNSRRRRRSRNSKNGSVAAGRGAPKPLSKVNLEITRDESNVSGLTGGASARAMTQRERMRERSRGDNGIGRDGRLGAHHHRHHHHNHSYETNHYSHSRHDGGASRSASPSRGDGRKIGVVLSRRVDHRSHSRHDEQASRSASPSRVDRRMTGVVRSIRVDRHSPSVDHHSHSRHDERASRSASLSRVDRRMTGV
eukprot:scaffold3091_cov186-Alexandrium_tamarense.AAC.1